MTDIKEELQEEEILEQEEQNVDAEDEQEKEQENEVNLEEELQAMKDKYLRLVAEFDNFRKRTNRERLDLINSAGESTIKELLPVLDDFDRAKSSADTEDSQEVFTEGVQMVYHKLFKTLERLGLEAMDTDGVEFDPEYHEAITEIEAGKKMKAKIVDTLEKGYTLNDKIIRYAKVVVGK